MISLADRLIGVYEPWLGSSFLTPLPKDGAGASKNLNPLEGGEPGSLWLWIPSAPRRTYLSNATRAAGVTPEIRAAAPNVAGRAAASLSEISRDRLPTPA